MAIPQQKPVAARPKQRRHKRRRVWKDKHYRWVPDGQGDWRIRLWCSLPEHEEKGMHTTLVVE